LKDFWCEINLDKLAYNVNLIKKNTCKKIIAVVKGNAYGLGIEEITRFLNDKVDTFAVSTMEEALKIQSNKDIIILTPLYNFKYINEMKKNIIITIDSEECLHKISKDTKCRIQIYVNTGMNRFGVQPNKLYDLIQEIKSQYKNIIIDGIYTHLHNDKDIKYTLKQIDYFKSITLPFINNIPNIHCLNSNAFLNHDLNKAADFTNCIRVGNLIYGYCGENLGYKKIFNYYAQLVRSYKVSKNQYIGYNNTFKTNKDIKVSLLNFGYIDNFGCSKNSGNRLIYNLLKNIFHYFRPPIFISNKGETVHIIGKFMNNVLINSDNISEDSILTVHMSSILADSSIKKEYIISNL